MGLHKLLPFLVPPPLFTMVQDPSFSYSKALQLTQQARSRIPVIVAVLVALLAVVAAKVLRMGAASAGAA